MQNRREFLRNTMLAARNARDGRRVLGDFNPYEGVKPEARKNVIGGQCCNWPSHTWNRFDLEWKIWPRGFALAEVLWTYPDPDNRDFNEFSKRAAEYRRRLISAHVNCAPLK